MDNSDLISAIDTVRDALMSHEEENQLQRIIDRLEGYELAYNVLLQKVERYEKSVDEFKEEYTYEHGWQTKNVEGNKRSQWHKGALEGFNHVKRIFDKHFQ
jgi:hypothetical protein